MSDADTHDTDTHDTGAIATGAGVGRTAPPITLTIAGSEATGGAGAQADLKTFQQLGTFGMVALTCIVSFDPRRDWGHRFVPIDAQVIADQLEAQLACYDVDAVKIGMLGTPATITTVADVLREQRFPRLVVDPVLICKGQKPGAALDTDNALREQVMPLATFVTPNLFEATLLAGMPAIETVDQLAEAARRIHESCGAIVLAKGGVRLAGPDAIDVFYDGTALAFLSAPKVGDVAVSGAGCTLAAAVTAFLALGRSPFDAAREAKEFVTAGIHARRASRAPFDALWQGAAR